MPTFARRGKFAHVVLAAIAALLAAAHPARSAAWMPDGTPVVDVAGDQRPAIALQLPDPFSPWSIPYLRLYWEDDRAGSGETDLYAADVDWQGPPGPPFSGASVVAAAGRQSSLALDRTGPIIVPTPAGARGAQSSDGSDLLLAWRDDRGGGTGGVWARQIRAFPAWADTGVQVCDVVPAEGSIGVAGGNVAGGGIIAWIDDRGGLPRVYAQRLDGAGTALWTSNGIPVSAGAALASGLQIGADGDGGAYLAWREVEPVTPPVAWHRLIVQRLDATGGVHAGWPAGGAEFGTSSLDVQPASVAPRLIATSSSGAIVLWLDPDGGAAGSRLYARALQGDGTPDPQWPVYGLALSGLASVVSVGGAALDAGLVVAWTDARSGVSWDVYAQRVLFDGTVAPGWDPDGQPVGVAAGDQVASAVLSRGGRTVIGWSDTRDGPARAWVGGLLVDGTPVPGWAGGIPLSTSGGGQSGPLLSWSLGDGIIAAWRDARDAGTSGEDIYAQTVNRFGEVGELLTGVPAPEPGAFRVLPARPDPSVGGVAFVVEHPWPGPARADILDLAGRRVRTLAGGSGGQVRTEFRWDGRDDTGALAPPGMYLFRVEIGGRVSARRFVRLR